MAELCPTAQVGSTKQLLISFSDSDMAFSSAVFRNVISKTHKYLRFASFIAVEVTKKLDGDKRPLRFGVLRFPGNRWFKDLVSKCGNWDVLGVFFLLLFCLFCTQFTHLLGFRRTIFIARVSVQLLQTQLGVLLS